MDAQLPRRGARAVLPSLTAAARLALWALGLVLLLRGALWAPTGFGLTVINETVPVGAPTRLMANTPHPFEAGWLAMLSSTTAGFLLLPRPTTRRPIDLWALAGAAPPLILTTAVTWLITAAGSPLPGQTCTYPGCWPLPWLDLTVSAPFTLALITTTILAIRPSTTTRTRQLLPASTYLCTTTALTLTWDPWILPFFAAPPPW